MNEGVSGCKGNKGGPNQDKTSTDRSALRKLMRMHECIHTHACFCVCARVCCDMPISSTPPSTADPSSIPPSYCPTPDPTLPGPAGTVAKKKDEKGNRFPPLWGAVTVDPSAQLRALSSGQRCPAGPPTDPRRTEAFEMSPQTPDSGDVPLSGGCGGALMTDSTFVFVNMPRQRR